MKTPICDFVDNYIESDFVRLHMPGHKGAGGGCEPWDITEICGADALYEAEGIIAESEANATQVFCSGASFYSTEGSSQVIKAMLYLIAMNEEKPLILAARNVHKAFVYGCALNDIAVEWLYPAVADSLCSCWFTAEDLRNRLNSLSQKPSAVYLTSPDYLGNLLDIKGMAAVCREYDIPLLVDNAHGAYLKFLPESLHPLDLGAAMCCDSAHKTLPVLTGGAYLQIGADYKAKFAPAAKQALSLFGSTSPSYLILQSLDKCNQYLAENCCKELAECIDNLNSLKARLRSVGYEILDSDPLKLTLKNIDGRQAAEILRSHKIECEFADRNYLVLMFTPQNSKVDYEKVAAALANVKPSTGVFENFSLPPAKQVMSIRRAVFSPWQVVPVENAVGRVCSVPLVTCPPAVPIVMSGEEITADMLPILKFYGITEVAVIK